jgi:hypothetical protein
MSKVSMGVRGAIGALVSALVVAAPASATLPGWGFEQVTPVEKNGAEPVINQSVNISPAGDGIRFVATMPIRSLNPISAPWFPQYTSRRGPDGWTTTDQELSLGLEDLQGSAIYGSVGGVSEDLSRSIVASRRVLAPGAVEGQGNVYRRDLSSDTYVLIGTTGTSTTGEAYAYESLVSAVGGGLGEIVQWASPDFSRLVLYGKKLTDRFGTTAACTICVYEWTATDGLKLASVLPDGRVNDYNAAANSNGPVNPNYVSADGRRILFTINDGPDAGLWVRIDGERTEPVSYSRLPGSDDRPFPVEVTSGVLASRSGRFVVFQTSPYTEGRPDNRLTSDAVAAQAGLYILDAEHPESLRWIGHAATKPLAVSEDGKTVYFISNAVLAEGAVESTDNVYVWHDGEIRLVGRGSGDFAVPTIEGPAAASPNGRYLAFRSPFQHTDRSIEGGLRCPTPIGTLIPAGTCREVYLYDAEQDTLVCASCPPPGQSLNGHVGQFLIDSRNYARMQAPIKLLDDGRVFFDTPEPLAREDANGKGDVYVYAHGEHRLVSRAMPNRISQMVGTDATGATVFISTDDPIVGQDRDTGIDIYATRLGGGIAAQNPVIAPPCAGVNCRGPVPAPPAPASIGSVDFTGGGNVPASPGSVTGAVSVARLKAVSGASGRLKVTVSAAGRISVSGGSVRRTSRSATKAATYSMTVALNAKAKRMLQRHRRLRAKVKVVFSPRSGSAISKSVTVTFVLPEAKSKGGR